MGYNELKEIIKHIKKVVPCSSCSKKFTDDKIDVLSVFGNDCLFQLSCPACSNQLVIHVTLTDQTQNDTKHLNIRTHNGPYISQNDVLDTHNFLNHFNGDFAKLFSSEPK